MLIRGFEKLNRVLVVMDAHVFGIPQNVEWWHRRGKLKLAHGRGRRLPRTAHKLDFSHPIGYNTRSAMELKTAA
jgi:hypothetical protein